ncbi:hypothetical protein niasHT_010784 [Heterodera trifolii]|uniref:Homeobox domain-containing protein n=1 Tax=Heterodera trifolii TaxID=157864 RepID=A0ABD2KX46_9BILA
MYQPPSSLLHNSHFATNSSPSSAETAKSATSLLMLDAFTSAVNFHNFAGCSASSSPFSVPSMLPHGPSSSNVCQSLCSPPCSSSGTSSSSLSLAHPSLMSSGKRERTKYSEQQLSYLERSFKSNPYPDVQIREQIAKSLQLTDIKVQVWFKNRRAKGRNETKMEQIRTGTHCHGTNAPLSIPSTAIGSFVKGEKRRNGDERTVTKREESVEDTEEENQQPPRKKTMSSGGTEAERGNKASSSSSCAFPSSDRQKAAHPPSATSASSSASFPLPYDFQKGLLIPQIDPFMYGPNLPPSSSSSSSSSASFPPISSSSAEMGSLMAAASNFPSQVPSFYSGWSVPSGYASAGFLSSPYASPGQVPQQLAPFVHPSAYYQQTNNYYFNNAQQSAAQRIELEPKNERE